MSQIKEGRIYAAGADCDCVVDSGVDIGDAQDSDVLTVLGASPDIEEGYAAVAVGVDSPPER